MGPFLPATTKPGTCTCLDSTNRREANRCRRTQLARCGPASLYTRIPSCHRCSLFASSAPVSHIRPGRATLHAATRPPSRLSLAMRATSSVRPTAARRAPAHRGARPELDRPPAGTPGRLELEFSGLRASRAPVVVAQGTMPLFWHAGSQRRSAFVAGRIPFLACLRRPRACTSCAWARPLGQCTARERSFVHAPRPVVADIFEGFVESAGTK
jgi:hypothetical protein